MIVLYNIVSQIKVILNFLSNESLPNKAVWWGKRSVSALSSVLTLSHIWLLINWNLAIEIEELSL